MANFVLRSTATQLTSRLGSLLVAGRPAVPTPNYIVPTSRGVVPHVTPDTLSKSTGIRVVYAGLEDYIERTAQRAPILQQPLEKSRSKLRAFTALPDDCVSILGPRRVPALDCPNQNTNSSVAICTATGFGSLTLDDYLRCSHELNSDINISLADVVTALPASQKRLERSADRTHAWLRDTLTARAEKQSSSHDALFATLLPLEAEQQSFYLSDLCDEYKTDYTGLCLTAVNTLSAIPEDLASLPRICLSNPESPQDILRAVSLGIDLMTVPFVTDASESGIAFSFSLNSEGDVSEQQLCHDLWDSSNAISTLALKPGCPCYTCTKHHRAYIHHLLSAKEMLAWTLLQIHNFHVVTTFFEQIRISIEDGNFEQKSAAFRAHYVSEMLKGTGQGPRVRGYQVKSSGGGEARKNEKAYGRLDDHVLKLEEAESGLPTPDPQTGAEELEKHGLGIVQP